MAADTHSRLRGYGPLVLTEYEAGRRTRISLDILVAYFKRGKSPEAIHDSYETVSLADVYAVLAYYLRHRAEVEAYLAEQELEAAEIQGADRGRIPAGGAPYQAARPAGQVKVRFLADETATATSSLAPKRRVDDVDIVRVQEVGLRTQDDPTILQWAADEGRVLVSHDLGTSRSSESQPGWAWQRCSLQRRRLRWPS